MVVIVYLYILIITTNYYNNPKKDSCHNALFVVGEGRVWGGGVGGGFPLGTFPSFLFLAAMPLLATTPTRNAYMQAFQFDAMASPY